MLVLIAMLFDPVVTIPMIIVGAMMRWQKMLVVAFVGAIAISVMMGSTGSGAQGLEGFVARFLAMGFSGLIGTVIYLQRMKKRARQAVLNSSSTQPEANV